MPIPDAMMREILEDRHGDSAMFYCSEMLALIKAHHEIVRLSNTRVPGLTDEELAQRKAIMQISARIVRTECLRLMKDYFLPEWDKWVEVTK